MRSPPSALLYHPQSHGASAGATRVRTIYWPTSHRLLYGADARFGWLARASVFTQPDDRPLGHQNWHPELQAAYEAAVERTLASVEPREFSGRAGDVLLLHGRCLHSGSENHSGSIRTAVFYDAVRRDCSPFNGASGYSRRGDGAGERPLPPCPSPPPSPWAGWAPAVQQAARQAML